MNVILIGLHLWILVHQTEGSGWSLMEELAYKEERENWQVLMASFYQTLNHLDFHSKLDYELFERNCVSFYLSLIPFVFFFFFKKCIQSLTS